MSTHRIHASGLAKLLHAAEHPVYVLDEELTIVFLNRACLEWLGPFGEGLVGCRCGYHSSPEATGPEGVAAGLCPPPQTLSGNVTSAVVSHPGPEGKPIERRARFLPLGESAENVIGIIAVLDVADRSAEESAASVTDLGEEGSIALHDHIRRFRQEAAARYRADRLIGQGPAMRLARRQVELAAASRASVLLVGPSGSGRRHLAAAIHYGRSADTTFCPLDCSLLGAELLGMIEPAVSRTSDSNPPGTLLLHRIDELSAEVQASLADFLAKKATRWRLIATSADPLADLVRRGKFRDDLAAMLCTIVIELPSLAQRRGDLPLLAQLFLEECNAAGGRQAGGFSPSALDRLDAYPWPGNLDELAQVVAESHKNAAGPEVGVNDLPERLRVAAQAAALPRRVDETIILDEYLGRVERELIRRALARAKGNKARAARLLGMTRPRLYRRMVQLGLE